MDKRSVLVAGATGYIASKLIPRLLESGYRVRCLARNPQRLRARTWFPKVEVVAGDVTAPSSLPVALKGVHTAYYLIHNMASGYGYTSRESSGAHHFAEAAGQIGLEHIIYLGGLADPARSISYHLRSRIDTGETLRKGKTPVTEFRAGVIVGPGSISFEMIRFMTELMPIIFGPVWLQNRAQPIAAQNVIDYLLEALENPTDQNRIFEIGGPDVMNYAELMLAYSRLRGMRRRYVIVPGIPVWFMALGVAWMTPVPAVIAKPLVDGMRSESVVQDNTARHVFPNVHLTGYEEAVTKSLTQLHPARLEPIWSGCEAPVKNFKHEGFFIDYRFVQVAATPEKVFEVVTGLGGKTGWLYADWLWKLRGWFDQLWGGPGMRGRQDSLKTGDALDFYRVEALEEERLLRLVAELKTPGQGWMEWRVAKDGEQSLLTQSGYFAPHGLPGFLYWHLLEPIHRAVFRGLLRTIARRSEKR